MMEFDYAQYFCGHGARKRELPDFEAVLRLLGNPERSFRAVHVAGTNGKGSTSAYIASILTASGFQTGLYTSPALSVCNERIRINGEPVTEDMIERESRRVAAAEEEAGVSLTGFDRMTATAFCIYEACGVDYAVLEAGLGGRKDSTNVVNARVAVLTAISLDHTAVLGSTYEEIAAEKCGVIKEGQTVISHPQRPEVMEIIEDTCARKHARLIRVENCQIEQRSFSPMGQWFCVTTPDERRYKLFTSMLGSHQMANAAAALLAAQALRLNARAIEQGIERTHWPARMEYFDWDPDILLDGAHNPHAAKALVAGLDQFFPNRFIILITAIMKDKDAEGILRAFCRRANYVIATSVNERSRAPEELVAIAERIGGVETHMADTYGHAYEAALQYSVDHFELQPLIVVAGSLYLAGAMREILIG